ncbi:putative UPF0769 protein C21orf59-like [Apostichopus japonicus]|uniref:Putative UPF0769 protein C21orf59-like n=1 Tax=Stichopus japonicus TaxID=307972 RepID=A0A2G8JGR5_STIJA|nr:putative UPF0769 protein C21orf59-like [Apostichopus japonicus]
MVKLVVKRGDESHFLYETTVSTVTSSVIKDLVAIHNGRLKIERLCAEISELSDHGVSLPPNMQGLTDEQIVDLKLKDECGEACKPSGGSVDCKDEVGRRNGCAPNDKMKEVLRKTMSEAKKIVSKDQIKANVCITQDMLKEAVDQLRGAVTIVYPMGLPPYDPICMEFEDKEELAGTQASLQVLEDSTTSIWFSGKELQVDKKLEQYVGKNEKTKLIVKLHKRGSGPPGREPVFSEEQRKEMMLDAYRRQEEWKKLEEDNENSYLDSAWADSSTLKKQFQGLKDVSWHPR